jgi:hypothetical protein
MIALTAITEVLGHTAATLLGGLGWGERVLRYLEVRSQKGVGFMRLPGGRDCYELGIRGKGRIAGEH